MAIAVHEYPFSSYLQKAKTTCEKGLPLEAKMIDGVASIAREFAALSPIHRFPVNVDASSCGSNHGPRSMLKPTISSSTMAWE